MTVPASSPDPRVQAPKPRTSRKMDPCIRALDRFSRVLEVQNPSAQRAAILWLADRYLGLKPRDWWR
jgi:hypothetical protein